MLAAAAIQQAARLCYEVYVAGEIPMERSEVIPKLKRHEGELKRLGVEHLYLFGS